MIEKGIIDFTEDRVMIQVGDYKVRLSPFDKQEQKTYTIILDLLRKARNNEDKFKDDVIQYSAGGLRDFTRIAASEPRMWRDIFIDNSDLIIQAIDKFSKNLDEFKKVIADKDGKKLIEIFNKSKELRKSIIKAGQETDKPDFGRK